MDPAQILTFPLSFIWFIKPNKDFPRFYKHHAVKVQEFFWYVRQVIPTFRIRAPGLDPNAFRPIIIPRRHKWLTKKFIKDDDLFKKTTGNETKLLFVTPSRSKNPIFSNEKLPCFIPKHPSYKREHQALQNMKFLNFFLFLWVIYAKINADAEPPHR